MRRGGSAGGETAIDFSADEEIKALSRADNTVDAIFLSGKETLESLYSQRSKLKGARKKMLDFANTVGVSKKLIKSIERRQNADLYILLAGMAIIFIVVIAIYLLKRRFS